MSLEKLWERVTQKKGIREKWLCDSELSYTRHCPQHLPGCVEYMYSIYLCVFTHVHTVGGVYTASDTTDLLHSIFS